VTYIAPNSIQARDIAHFIHPQPDLVRHEQEGPVVISPGRGIYVYDESGRECSEGAAERNIKKHVLILRVFGNRIALSPPVIITESEVDELVSRLRDALDDTLVEIETG